MTEDEIDEELRDAQKRMATLRKKNRPLRSNALPKKINDFQLLAELRDLLRNPPITGTLSNVRPTLSSLYSFDDTSEEDYKSEILLGVRRRSPKKGKTRTRFASTHAVKHGWLDLRSAFISAATKENAVVWTRLYQYYGHPLTHFGASQRELSLNLSFQ